MAQESKIEIVFTIGSIVLGILEVQVRQREEGLLWPEIPDIYPRQSQVNQPISQGCPLRRRFFPYFQKGCSLHSNSSTPAPLQAAGFRMGADALHLSVHVGSAQVAVRSKPKVHCSHSCFLIRLSPGSCEY